MTVEKSKKEFYLDSSSRCWEWPVIDPNHYNKDYVRNIVRDKGLLTKIIHIVSNCETITEDIGDDLVEVGERTLSITIENELTEIVFNAVANTERGDHQKVTVANLNKLLSAMRQDVLNDERSLGTIFTSKRAKELLAEGTKLSEQGFDILGVLETGRFDKATVLEYLNLSEWPNELGFFECTELEILANKYSQPAVGVCQ